MTKQQLKEIVYNVMYTTQDKMYSLVEITRLVYQQLIELGVTIEDDILFTYQYDLRWCLQSLRNDGSTSYKKVGNHNYHYVVGN